MRSQAFILVILAATCLAAENEPCYGSSAQGVCVTTSACSASGGTTIDGACPSDPDDIKCCSKPTCSVGNCRWKTDCLGSTVTGECPGPADFQCCDNPDTEYGGYEDPDFPDVGACLEVSVEGAQTLVAAWPGRTPTLGGNQIAEWAMENRDTLDLKYVIWGQRIWEADSDEETTWSHWTTMEDRGDITANHWDHVHVSFNY